jgi:hypothetical protein
MELGSKGVDMEFQPLIEKLRLAKERGYFLEDDLHIEFISRVKNVALKDEEVDEHSNHRFYTMIVYTQPLTKQTWLRGNIEANDALVAIKELGFYAHLENDSIYISLRDFKPQTRYGEGIANQLMAAGIDSTQAKRTAFHLEKEQRSSCTLMLVFTLLMQMPFCYLMKRFFSFARNSIGHNTAASYKDQGR